MYSTIDSYIEFAIIFQPFITWLSSLTTSFQNKVPVDE